MSSILKQLREFSRKNLFLRKFVGYYLASSGLFDDYFRNYQLSKSWQGVIDNLIACPDNALISRCPQAGRIKNGKQVLHNGIRIHVGSYYGPEYAQMLIRNKGVHDPQEVKAFSEVLPCIPENGVMLELGSSGVFSRYGFTAR